MKHRLGRLAELRKRRGLTQSGMAALMKVSQPAYQRWETGNREPTLDQTLALANLLGVSVPDLLGQLVAAPLGPMLFIQGSVAAGIWRDALEYPREDWLTFSGRADIVANPDNRFGLRVEGDSMDQAYPPGTIIECLSAYDSADLTPGKRVVVTRTNASGEIEATVKELAEQAGELWLVPKSTNPIHTAFKLDEADEGIVEVKILAVVVASIRPE
ncbi:HTH_XRE domain containing protein [uncultured Caudovirales phage]|uniref:HTH_XRE domain containing protein n=1 Tax=uncultured Caudovirales phage TaxID=2100421 RepID=A0A6J7WZ23_9CAUD|nr:HTH_XRE domain containing protein [uncultured Caudovirales phage]